MAQRAVGEGRGGLETELFKHYKHYLKQKKGAAIAAPKHHDSLTN